MELKIGMTNEKTTLVDETNIASVVGSSLLDVFATPMMCALMEQAAGELVYPYLDEGMSTVGVALNITHDAPSPIGMTVTATAKLIDIDRRKLTFEVEAHDEVETIGKGIHVRFIVPADKFMEKVDSKRK